MHPVSRTPVHKGRQVKYSNCRQSTRLARLLGPVVLASIGLGAAWAQGIRDQTAPGGVSAYAYQPVLGAAGARIKLGWGRPSRVPSSYILGYVIWRSDTFAPTQVVGGFFGDSNHGFIDSEATRNVTAYSGDPGSDDAGSATQFQSVPGIQPGQQYRYQVAAAYNNGLQDRDGDGMPDQGSQFMSPLSGGSGFVTAIAPGTVTTVNGTPATPGVQVDLSNLTVEWAQTPGADTYVIWVATDPGFRKGKKAFNVGKTLPVDLGGPATTSATINASKSSAIRKARQVYISVGARRSGEPKPRPYGAIFSPPVVVTPETGPPPPPNG